VAKEGILARRGFQIGLASVAMLVLLRVTIGWHFLYQGMSKLDDPNFSSAGFLSQAKGPLADRYRGMIPDYYGQERLDQAKLFAGWDAYLDRAKTHFGLSPDQSAAAARMLEGKKGLAEQFFEENGEAIRDYFYELDRWQKAAKDPQLGDVEFQKKRAYDREKALLAQASPWLKQVDTWTDELSADVRDRLTSEQRQRAELPVRADSLAGTDKFITYTNLAIGFCLMVGLLTRFASLSGGLFLLSIVLAQPELPGIYPPAPAVVGRSLVVTKEFIEMVAMFTLATLPVGRWGGLDFFVHHFLRRTFAKRESP
jgi:uncharacterized membrane protein YphA (DoxX/SURF4 family)